MQLSQTAEYALRAVVYLAQHEGDPQTNRQIADGCRMPVSYLAKVLHTLLKADLITAQRGVGGGYGLARKASELRLIEMVNAVEPVQRIRCCPMRSHATGHRLCALHQALDDAMAEVERALSAKTVGQLLNPGPGMTTLCEAPLVEPSAESEQGDTQRPRGTGNRRNGHVKAAKS